MHQGLAISVSCTVEISQVWLTPEPALTGATSSVMCFRETDLASSLNSPAARSEAFTTIMDDNLSAPFLRFPPVLPTRYLFPGRSHTRRSGSVFSTGDYQSSIGRCSLSSTSGLSHSRIHIARVEVGLSQNVARMRFGRGRSLTRDHAISWGGGLDSQANTHSSM